MKPLLLFVISVLFSLSTAAGELVKIPTRSDVSTSLFWHRAPDAIATLFVFPGGGGGFGKLEDGWPGSGNFLVRTSRLWAQQGFNLAIFGRPDDSVELGFEDRISEKHLQDVSAALDWVKNQSAAPVWVIGTSRGTISAAATLIHIQDGRLAGGVLTASVVNYKKAGALPKQDLPKIKVPVLVYHHKEDACEQCKPYEVSGIMSGLKNASVKKLMMVSGGGPPTGGVCEAQHWHGFIGMESLAVSEISAWINKPVN